MRSRFLFLCAGVLLLLAGTAMAQNTSAGLWTDISESSLGPVSDRVTVPQVYRTMRLNESQMTSRLDAAPAEARPGSTDGGIEMPIPLPNGGFATVRVVEASIMAPELQARYPELRTYLVEGKGAMTGRLSYTPEGFRGLLLTPEGTVYIDPYTKGDSENYIVYYTKDVEMDPAMRSRLGDKVFGEASAPTGTSKRAPNGDTVRTYRLAMAATGEYTAFHGGTKAQAVAAIVVTVNRVISIYERDVAVRFQLIANTDQVVYTDAATDPYTNDNGDMMLAENQANLDAVIGDANYDVGHVFSTGGGGVALLGIICETGFKGQGVTGLPTPVGEQFAIEFVSHEMGHQFGANHSFNGTEDACSNRNASTAYEPGSGSTIMSYAGICGSQDINPGSEALFHRISLDQITAHITSGSGSTCGTTAATGNALPTVTAPGPHTIPADTPFSLTAVGADADTPGSNLTYAWDGFDIGVIAGPAGSPTPPFFRSFLPMSSPTRTFPQMGPLLAGQPPVAGERLPSDTRTLNFRVTVRDNNAGAGGIGDDAAVVNVHSTGSPFTVTFASTTGQSYSGAETVTWNVAGTASAPINTANVDILFSTDNGATFPTVLASATPNDGTQEITFPAVNTTEGRILIRGTGNIFFNVNAQPFTVSPSTGPTATLKYAPGSVTASLNTGGTTTEPIAIQNTAASGAAALTWSAAVQNTKSGSPIFSVSPTSGSVVAGGSETMTVSVDALGLATGTYTANIVVTTNDPANPSVTIPAWLLVNATAGTARATGNPGWRLFAPAAPGMTVDDLAAMNRISGIPGHDPTSSSPNILTTYNGTAYGAPASGTEALASGRGFFWYLYDVNFTDAAPSISYALPMVLATPNAVTTSDVPVTLHADGTKWNMLGNPFGQNMSLTGLSGWTGASNLSSTTGYVYNASTNSWDLTTTSPTITPWQGFILNASTAGGLTIPETARVTAPPFSEVEDERVFLAFELSEEGGPLGDRGAIVYFDDAASAGQDAFDVVQPAPLTENHVLLAFGSTSASGASMLRGQEGRSASGGTFEVPMHVEAVGSASTLTLTWPSLDRLPSTWGVSLRDVETGTVIDLRDQDRYTFEVASTSAAPGATSGEIASMKSTDAPVRFVLTMSPLSSTAGEAGAEGEVALASPMPNPARQEARIGFALPRGGEATLAVYDVQGREVARLAHGTHTSGHHTVVWNTSALAAGVYVVRLSTEGSVLTRRAVVVR